MELPDRTPADRALHLACFLTLAVAAVACLPSLGIPIGLSAEGDALDYHLPIIKWIARHGAYPNWNWTYVDDTPLLGELLMVPFYLVKTELARLVAIAAYFGTALFTALIGAELASPPANEDRNELTLFLFACSLGFQPILVQACHVMVDNIANCFALGALYYVLRRRVVPGGIFLAGALATKYTVWGAAPGALLALWIVSRDRRRDIPVFVALAAVGALPFLIRNLVLNHNPAYPLLDGIFHGTPYDAPSGWGRGQGIGAMLLFPWDLFVTNTFVHDLFDLRSAPSAFYAYTLGFLTYVEILALAAALWITRGSVAEAVRRSLRDPRVRAIIVFWLCCFLFWWYGFQILRYFGHGMALVSLAILLPMATRLPKWPRVALALVPILSIAYVQQESWKIAFGKEQAFRDSSYVQSALDCFRRAGVKASDVVGYRTRDGINGFLDYDFVFYPPDNIYRQLPGTEPPKPEWLFSAIDLSEVAGYRKWPDVKPCILKRM